MATKTKPKKVIRERWCKYCESSHKTIKEAMACKRTNAKEYWKV